LPRFAGSLRALQDSSWIPLELCADLIGLFLQPFKLDLQSNALVIGAVADNRME